MFSAALNPVQSSDQSLFLSLADGVLQAPLAFRANGSAPNRILLTGGEVFINGTHADNVARVTELDTQTIRVSLVGIETREFSIADVDSIRFLGRKGDDIFRNDTAIPAHAYGLEGDDLLRGGSGPDELFGGSGNDRLWGESGDDRLFGESGHDELLGGAGADRISGAMGNDVIFGGQGDDDVTGDAGDDDVHGGTGDDLVHGWTGRDRLFGDSGDDWVLGYAGNDELDGGYGNDVLRGGHDDDQLDGSFGNDVLEGGYGNDVLQGGEGVNRLFGVAGNDVLRSGVGASSFYGGTGNDVIYGSISANYISGGAGDDTIFAGGGDDQVHGGDGADALHGQAGNDWLGGGRNDDVIYGGDGNDSLYGGQGIDQLAGGRGADYFVGGDGPDTLFSIPDSHIDRLVGGGGADRVLYSKFDEPGADISDLRVQLINKSSAWTLAEARVISRGLDRLYDATGNSRLARDNVVGKDLTLEKYRSLSGGAAAINYMTYSTSNGRTTYDRAIRFADWDESNEPLNAAYELAFVHEIAHNFDDDFELAAVPPVSIQDWNAFAAISGWRKNRPNNNYVRSGDGQWWYHRNAQFFRSYGNWSPAEDWATSWELFFDQTAERPPANSNLGRKLARVTIFMSKMSA